MSSLKHAVALFFSMLICQSAAANPYVDEAMNTMMKCYNQEHKIGSDLGECIGAVLNKRPNPELYKMYIHDDNPSQTLLRNIYVRIYNKSGYQLSCTGTAQQTIIIKSCITMEGKPLTTGQMISITPPAVPPVPDSP